MDETFIYAAVAFVCLLYLKRRRNKRWRNRIWWCRPVNQRRDQQEDFDKLFRELKRDETLFFRYCRMDLATFLKLLEMMRVHLTKENWRAVNPEMRLIITLRYLATGDQPLSIALSYRIGESTTLSIIKETCQVIGKILMPVYLACPVENEWRAIMQGFLEQWNLPNCIGAVDGKHILIQAPPNSGSQYFNYKKTFSTVLMAACNSKYKFTLVDIGAYGSTNDSGVFSQSEFGKAIAQESLYIPRGWSKLPGSEVIMPAYFVGDDAFALSGRMMKPYPGKHLCYKEKVFNYRLSRARRAIENTFGIMVSRWRIFRKPIGLNPESIDSIVLAAVCLHNFLMSENENRSPTDQLYCPPNFIDHESREGTVEVGEWRLAEASGRR